MKAMPRHSHLCLEPKSCPVLSTPQWFAQMKPIRPSGSSLISSLIHALSFSLSFRPWSALDSSLNIPRPCPQMSLQVFLLWVFGSSIPWPPYVCLLRLPLTVPFLPKRLSLIHSSKESSSPHIVSAFSFPL